MFKKLLVVATLAAGLISTQASAEFVSTDWKISGDKGATLDTSTGLEWLDLTHTFGKSYSTVSEQLATTYAGWRLPTFAEIVQLTTNIFEPYGKSAYVSHFASVPAVSQFKALFGSSVYSRYQVGFYKDSSGTVRVTGVDDYLKYMLGLNHGYTYSVDGISTGHGVWLVSDGGTTLSSINDPSININNPNAPINMADVSAPAGLAAASLLMLMLGARRKTA